MFNPRLIRSIVPYICVLLFAMPFSINADEMQKNKVVNHIIEIELRLKDHTLKAIDHMSVPCNGAEKVSCLINRSFRVLSVNTLGKRLYFTTKNIPRENAQHLEIAIPPDLRSFNELIFDIAYEGSLAPSPEPLEQEDVGETAGTISERGVYLSPACLWYPEISSSMATFKITTITPAEYEVVTQGTLMNKKSVDNKIYTTWEENHISEGCYLVAGKYKVTNIKHNGIDIYTFFFPEEQDLAQTYRDATVRYLDMYQKLLGNYPYEKFAVVENFFQTGYGMPSFTLLGSTVVKLPFIVEISLGHEILHNWWGNSVFVDESQGNWCEGLTTYMADYYYKELSNTAEAETYRKDICRKYTNYVTKRNDFPLSQFIGRTDQATQAVGYGKTTMVFHMLRRMVGDELFYRSLRKFYQDKIWHQAGWKDIQHVFEDTCKMDLSWFFNQWIHREGAPFIELGKTEVEKTPDGWVTRGEILQKDTPYRLTVPIYLESEDGNFSTSVEIKDALHTISIPTKSQPHAIAIDPHNDLFRRLSTEEIPPTIDLVLGDEDKVVIYPADNKKSSEAAYKKLARVFAEHGGVIKADIEIGEQEITQKSLFILGGLAENKLTKQFLENLPKNFLITEDSFSVNGIVYNNQDNALLVTLKNPKNKKKGIAILFAFNPGAIEKLGSKIPHYGKYSYLIFAGGKNIDKGIFAVTDSPLQRYLNNK